MIMNGASENVRASSLNSWIEACILVSYVLIMAGLWSAREVPYTGYETDGVYYMIRARSLFTPEFAPPSYGGGMGMVLSIRAANLVLADTFSAAKLVSISSGFVMLLASMRVARRLRPGHFAAIVGLFVLLNPLLIAWSTTSLSDALGAALPMVALWALLEPDRRWRIFVAGFCLGLAWTTRYLNIVFWPLLIVPIVQQRGNRKRVLEAPLLAIGALLLGSLPQLLVNVRFFGNPFHSDNWRNIAALVRDWTEVDQLTSFGPVLREDGLILAITWFKRFLIQVPESLYHVAFLPFLLAIPGYVLLVRTVSGQLRGLIVVWGITSATYLFLVAPVWRIELRYFLPVVSLILICGLYAWFYLMERNRPVLISGIVLALLISAGATVENIRELLDTQNIAYKEAGLYLHDVAAPTDVILATQPQVFFYADRSGFLLDRSVENGIGGLTAIAKTNHVRWIVFDEVQGQSMYPQLSELLDPNSTNVSAYQWRFSHKIVTPTAVVIWQEGH